MTHQDKVAIARILSDIVRADNIIDEAETKMFVTFFGEGSKYKLRYDILKESRSIRFSDAVMQIEKLSKDERQKLYNDVVELSLVDGVCDSREAIFITALKYYWGIDDVCSKKDISLVSCLSENIREDNRFVIYIEKDYDDILNREISNNLNLISLMLNQWGFHFIYIPKIVDTIGNMSEKYVISVLKYIAPDLTEKQVRDVFERTCSLTTSEFYNRVLLNKLKMNCMKSDTPSLLVNIGTSIVPYYSHDAKVDYYTEFLSIGVGESVVKTVENFIDMFSNIVSTRALPDSRTMTTQRGNNFRYFGFYKSILDFLVKAENMVGQIVLCPHTSSLYVPIMKKEVALSPQECAIYHLIAEMSVKGCGLPSCFTNKKEMSDIYRRFKVLYGNRSSKQQDFPSSIPPIVSRINKKIKSELSTLENLNDFLPVNECGYYHLRVQQEYIKQSKTPHNALNGNDLYPIIAILQK